MLCEMGLNTVCREARCPNISECFGNKTATFLILGDTCTRNCRFCAVQKGSPRPLDSAEPLRVAEAARRLCLRHVVVTSVTRDDLPDGGSGHFVLTVQALRRVCPQAKIELLIPDFKADKNALESVAYCGADIIGHNIETVPRLYPELRQMADYRRSLEVIRALKQSQPGVVMKSGIMLGLGEREEEVLSVFQDLFRAGCEFLSVGQYLCASNSNLAVKEYVEPERFAYYRAKALETGFSYCASAPYVRSSYLASQYKTNEERSL